MNGKGERGKEELIRTHGSQVPVKHGNRVNRSPIAGRGGKGTGTVLGRDRGWLGSRDNYDGK